MAASLKERLLEEMKVFWVIAFYLWLFLGSFVLYRQLVAAEFGAGFLNYGFALVQSLIIAKVVLVGRMFAFTRRFDERALIVPVIYKTLLFGLLVIVFTVIERLVEGWIHHEGLLGGLNKFREVGGYEIAARVLMLTVAFVPFFAFGELGRVIGKQKLTAMFFSSRAVEGSART